MPDSPRRYLESLEQIGIKLGLDQIRALVAALNHPDTAYPSIVIAGTNGKGSVTAMVERGLRAAGYRTGRYTSPHLVNIEERIAIDGQPIGAAEFDRAAQAVCDAAAGLPAPPSFFEATTALALDVFRAAAVDVAVLEVGLGGRLDATNVVTPIAVAITSIDFDHQAYLGTTLEAIAREKAGVIKPGTVAVLAPNSPVAATVVADAAHAAGAALIDVARDSVARSTFTDGRIELTLETPAARYATMTLALRGRHQADNAMTAVRLLEVLNQTGRFRIPDTAIRTAITDVVWPARLELLPWRGGSILIDGAHNPAGAAALVAYVNETYGRPLPFLIGMMKDKAVHEMVRAFGRAAAQFIVTAPPNDRAMTPDDLASCTREAVPSSTVIVRPDVASALDAARPLGDPVVVGGSLYLAGEVRARVS